MCKTKEVKQILSLFLIIQSWFIFGSGPKFCACVILFTERKKENFMENIEKRNKATSKIRNLF